MQYGLWVTRAPWMRARRKNFRRIFFFQLKKAPGAWHPRRQRSARIVEALGINSGRAKSRTSRPRVSESRRRTGAGRCGERRLETQPQRPGRVEHGRYTYGSFSALLPYVLRAGGCVRGAWSQHAAVTHTWDTTRRIITSQILLELDR
eukprot:7381761-Prymnesium_polylepis.2